MLINFLFDEGSRQETIKTVIPLAADTTMIFTFIFESLIIINLGLLLLNLAVKFDISLLVSVGLSLLLIPHFLLLLVHNPKDVLRHRLLFEYVILTLENLVLKPVLKILMINQTEFILLE